MKKTKLTIILVLALVLCTGITAFAAPRSRPDTLVPTSLRERAFDAYAASPFTIKNVIIYDNIEITSVKSNSRIVLYSGPEVNESTVITSSNNGYINWYVPVSGYYTLTWTDTWGGGWYSY